MGLISFSTLITVIIFDKRKNVDTHDHIIVHDVDESSNINRYPPLEVAPPAHPQTLPHEQQRDPPWQSARHGM